MFYFNFQSLEYCVIKLNEFLMLVTKAVSYSLEASYDKYEISMQF